MEDTKTRMVTDIRTTKGYTAFFLLSSIAFGLVGVWIPVRYVYTHHLTNGSLADSVVFDLIVIFFGMSFMVIWMFSIYFVTKYILGLLEKKK